MTFDMKWLKVVNTLCKWGWVQAQTENARSMELLRSQCQAWDN